MNYSKKARDLFQNINKANVLSTDKYLPLTDTYSLVLISFVRLLLIISVNSQINEAKRIRFHCS